jgi:co-chaperonin GroES (HSP10)
MLPCNDKILVAEVAKEETTASGLILAGADLETGAKPAMVIAVGPDADQKLVGHKVAIRWNEALAVTVEGQQRALIKEEHIWGIFN